MACLSSLELSRVCTAKFASTPSMSVEPTSNVHVDVLAGHIGHLTDAQQQAFATFQKSLAKAHLYKPASQHADGTTVRASHDDPTLL